MLRAVVTQSGASVKVRLLEVLSAEEEEAEEGLSTEEGGHSGPEKDLNPIFPEMKEVLWGFGSFVVFALLMRFFLYPRLKKSMDARYEGIRHNLESADTVKASAERDVAEYQAALASARAEAGQRVDAARQTLEAERTAKLAEVNGRVAEKRSAAAAQADAARAAARGQIESAVGGVASRIAELATGKAPAAGAVSRAVSDTVNAGVGS